MKGVMTSLTKNVCFIESNILFLSRNEIVFFELSKTQNECELKIRLNKNY